MFFLQYYSCLIFFMMSCWCRI